MAKKFDAEAHIVGLNTLRYQLAKTPFTRDTIREGFKSCGIPSNLLFWSVFFNSGLIQQIGEDLYCFNDPTKPIHFLKLDRIYREYQENLRRIFPSFPGLNKKGRLFRISLGLLK